VLALVMALVLTSAREGVDGSDCGYLNCLIYSSVSLDHTVSVCADPLVEGGV
jgi:hypothetical protein